jgi:hypothetical protein
MFSIMYPFVNPKSTVIWASFFMLLACVIICQADVTVDQIVYDHCGQPYRSNTPGIPWGKNEGYPHGMPSNWKQYEGAFPNFWSSPYQNQVSGTYYGAIQPWGQCYEWQGQSPVTNIRIQIRNYQLYAYTLDNQGQGSWTQIFSPSIGLGGSYYTESSFSGTSGPAPRDESGNGGGKSWEMVSGKLIHWWPSVWPRKPRPDNLVAYYAVCEARLIPNTDPGVNLNQAKYVAAASIDVYVTTTTSGSTPAMSIPRHKFLKPEWITLTSYITESIPTSVTQYRNQILSRPLPPGVILSSETNPPTPNPAQIQSYSSTNFSVTLTAVEGTDVSLPVQYFFDETSGNSGGSDSGWQTGTTYTDSGLMPGKMYTYMIVMKDAIGNQTTTSLPVSIYTLGNPDLNTDGVIDLADISELSLKWKMADCLNNNLCNGVDINVSDTVDLRDLEMITQRWLEVVQGIE